MKYIIYGKTNTGTVLSGIWPVAVVDSEEYAISYCDLCTKAANEKYRSELAIGFTPGDSISIQNKYDPDAHYNRFHYDNDVWSVDTEYFYKPVHELNTNEDVVVRYFENPPRSFKSYKYICSDDPNDSPEAAADRAEVHDAHDYYDSIYL